MNAGNGRPLTPAHPGCPGIRGALPLRLHRRTFLVPLDYQGAPEPWMHCVAPSRFPFASGIHGFTLIELMVTLAVAAILLTGVVPMFENVINDTRTTSRANAIVGGLGFARATSVYSGKNVVLCPSTDGQHCWRSMHWDRGWIAFLDRNANGVRDTADDLLRVCAGHARRRDHHQCGTHPNHFSQHRHPPESGFQRRLQYHVYVLRSTRPQPFPCRKPLQYRPSADHQTRPARQSSAMPALARSLDQPCPRRYHLRSHSAMFPGSSVGRAGDC